jgi:two-component sensor histidine kinase
MSLIHEQLYQTENLARIDFATYVRRLASNLMRSYGLAANIDLEMVVGGEALLSLNEAIPCGLIINELVSNALKHGFTAGQGGKVQVGLQVEDKQITLAVADNGVGLPENFDLYQINSLGLQLVTLLTRQLHGTLTLDRLEQTRFTVSFTSRP